VDDGFNTQTRAQCRTYSLAVMATSRVWFVVIQRRVLGHVHSSDEASYRSEQRRFGDAKESSGSVFRGSMAESQKRIDFYGIVGRQKPDWYRPTSESIH
jgi:hypothetical protein